MTLPDFVVVPDEDVDVTGDGTEIGIDSDVRYCACGCGEKLPSGYSFKYRRGHKLGAMSGDVPADPDRANDDAVRRNYPSVRITKKMREDIEGKVGFFLMLIATGWSARDETCGGSLGENVDKIAEKSVPVICKSPELVKWLTRSGNLTDIIELCLAVLPVAKMVANHHVFHSVQTQEQPAQLYPVG